MTSLDALFGEAPTSDWPDFPLTHLSPSSIDSFWKCAEAFRRERIAKIPTPASDKMLFGSAFGKAAERNYVSKMETGNDLPDKQMRDVTGDSFNEVVEEEKGKREISWHEFGTPAKAQTGVMTAMLGSTSLPGYHQVVAPTITPVAVERSFEHVTKSGLTIKGRIDLETADGGVIDIKTTGRAKTQAELNKDNQARAYLWAREKEGNPATRFSWHVVKRNITKPGLDTTLSIRQADTVAFERLVDMTARTISSYVREYGEDGPWPPAPPMAWWCSPTTCSFYAKGCPWRTS